MQIYRRFSRFLLLSIAGLAALTGCHPQIRATVPGPLTAAQVAQLWVEPPAGRDLFYGVGGPDLAPDPSAKYRIIEIKQGGFSQGYTVLDAREREWSAKLPPEAQTEIVASRLHWGIGYHQPPLYLLKSWSADKPASPNPQPPSRFREKKPDLSGPIEAGDPWSYFQNPFVGTRQLAGLLVLQVMLGNSDLKDLNNTIYTLPRALEGATTWYVARDLGHTFGRTGVLNAPRGDPDVFEKTRFITGVDNGEVRFNYGGRHRALFQHLKVEDVRWVCGLLNRLTDRQWRDAFRAGGYEGEIADRFIRAMKARISEGLALPQ
jgi:hypothetical protein